MAMIGCGHFGLWEVYNATLSLDSLGLNFQCSIGKRKSPPVKGGFLNTVCCRVIIAYGVKELSTLVCVAPKLTLSTFLTGA